MMNLISDDDFVATVAEASYSEANEKLALVRKTVAAASDLPIELILSMVLEGLEILDVYRNMCTYTDPSEAKEAARRRPRPLLEYYSSLVRDFVLSHDMEDEGSADQLGATATAAGGASPLTQSNPSTPTHYAGAQAAAAIDAVKFTMNAQKTSDDTYYAILAKIRTSFDSPCTPAVATNDRGRSSSSVLGTSLSLRAGGGGGYGKETIRIQPQQQQQQPQRCIGIEEHLFCEFVAPALTLTVDEDTNRRFIAQTNVTQSGYITWDAFSNFFVKVHGDTLQETNQVQFLSSTSATQHNAAVRKLLFTKPRSSAKSYNPTMDRYCVSGGYDGTVHMWDTNFYDHACRVHYIPNANKSKRWINDLAYTGNGRLAIAQSRGFVYIYGVMNPLSPYLHRVFRSSSALSEDEESAVRVELERVRLSQGKTRFSAAEIPLAEVCIMNSPIPGDIVSVHGPREITKFSVLGHMEPLLVGLDTGLVHLYNVFKPIEFKAQISPIQTFHGFAKGDIYQVLDNTTDNNFFCAGRSAKGTPAIHIVDYEKCEATLTLQLSHSSITSTSTSSPYFSLSRVDYDDALGLLVASGASRSAVIFSTSFPDPVTVLSDHSSPIVGAAVNAASHHIYTFTDDSTFHLFDIRMFRKLQTFSDHSNLEVAEQKFSCGAFDGVRGTAVGASSSPVALVIQQQQTVTSQKQLEASTRQQLRKGASVTPSGLAAELRHVHYSNIYKSLTAAEGNYVVLRSGDDLKHQDAAIGLPDTVIAFAMDDGERRTAALVQGREIHLLTTIGGSRLLTIKMSSLERSDEGTTICFAYCAPEQLVLVAGSFGGVVTVYDLANDGEVLFTMTCPSAILCLCPVTQGKQRVLVGTAEGDVVLLHLDTLTATKVLDFEAAHLFRSKGDLQQDGVKEQTSEKATESLKRRSDSLANFRNKSHSAMDRAVEAFAEGFDINHTFIMYGTGVVLMVRLSHVETLTVLEFPTVERHTSASAIGVSGPRLHLVAVGDFNGNVTLFNVHKATRTTSFTPNKLAMNSSSSSMERTMSTHSRELSVSTPFTAQGTLSAVEVPQQQVQCAPTSFVDFTVELEYQIAVTNKSLISEISFVNESERMVVALAEVLTIVVMSLDGDVLSVLKHESMPVTIPQHLATTGADNSHPFFQHFASQHQHKAERPNLKAKPLSGFTANPLSGSSTSNPLPRPQRGARMFDESPLEEQQVNGHRAPTGYYRQSSPTSCDTEPLTKAGAQSLRSSLNCSTAESESRFGGPPPHVKQKPTFSMPRGTPAVLSSAEETTPRGRSAPSYPSVATSDMTTLKLSCNEFHPISASASTSPRRPIFNAVRRPVSAKALDAAVVERMYPKPPPLSSHTMGVSASTAKVQPAPLIVYPGLTAHPSITTSDVDRLKPPTYVGQSKSARPPSAPIFQYKRKTEEMSHRTEKLLQDAVDTANTISSRIVSNLKQRRLLSGSAAGGRSGDGRVFLTLEQQPLSPEMLKAVSTFTAPKAKKS